MKESFKMSEEVMVLCKKALPYSSFEEGKWYKASKQFKTNEEKKLYGWRSSYWVYEGISHKYYLDGARFYETKEQPGDNLYSDYFYTDNELRKEKLKKLNRKVKHYFGRV